MSKEIILAFLWALWMPLQAQDTCVFKHLISQKAHFATADHLGNTYLLHGFELEKYDSTGHFVSRYSTNRLGSPTYVDVFNPLKIMIWYGDFQTIVFLDRNLTELGKVNMAQAGFPALRGLSVSADGNLWAYDELTAQLIKLSHSGVKLLESQPLNLDFARSLRPTCIRDNAGQGPWMSDPGLGVAIFDPYMRASSVIPVKDLQSFVIHEDMACFLSGDGIQMEPVRGFVSRSIPFPNGIKNKALQMWLAPQNLLVLTEKGVEVYEIR